MRKHAFTLIELLVVVAIIVALLAILLPSMGKAIGVAQMAACGANERQISLATTSYQADNFRFFPGHYDVARAHVAYTGRLLKYVGHQRDVWYCPTAPEEARWVETTGYASSAPQANGYEAGEVPIFWNTKFSYGYNDWGIREATTPHFGLGGHVGDPKYGEVSMSQVVAPASMIVFGDSDANGVWDTAIDPEVGGAGNPEYPEPRHLDQYVSIVWADGHVSQQSFESITDMSDSSIRSMWNNDNKPHFEFGY